MNWKKKSPFTCGKKIFLKKSLKLLVFAINTFIFLSPEIVLWFIDPVEKVFAVKQNSGYETTC